MFFVDGHTTSPFDTNFRRWIFLADHVPSARRQLKEQAMLVFERLSSGETDRSELAPKALIVAGWTGRDEKALRHHIEELAAIGVPRPSSVPVFYRISTANLTQTAHLEVLGLDTSGEAEPVVVAMHDGLWLGVGSDHTDRKLETMGVALSKQFCAKMVGKTLWRLDEIAGHWDQLILRAYVTIDGKRLKYQEGPLSAMRNPSDLMSRAGTEFVAGTVMFCGTLGAIGGIRPAAQFTALIEDPVLGREMSCEYDVKVLPVVR
jgi:Protein of unknown function (DUF2848)